MSTELSRIPAQLETDSPDVTVEISLAVTRFFGGVERGMCIQLTPPHGSGPYIQITLEDLKKIVKEAKKGL